MVGINATSSTGDSFGITYKGFPSGELSSPGYGNKVSGLPSNSDSKSRLFGALGTFNYSFDNILFGGRFCTLRWKLRVWC